MVKFPLCITLVCILSVSAEPITRVTADSFYRQLLPLQLRDSQGRAFRVTHLMGDITLVNFIFTHCSWVCPTQTKNLLDVYKALPPSVIAKINFVSVSIDPQRDTPQAMAGFAAAQGAVVPRWYFVTGNLQATVALLQSFPLIDTKQAEPNNGQRDHQTDLWLIDKKGKLRMRYNGLFVDKPRMVREISQLSALP